MSLTRRFRRQLQRKRSAAQKHRKVHFEPLEPRILLSNDPSALSFTAAGAAVDLTLRIEEVDGTDTLQLIDTGTLSVLQARALDETSAVDIIGSDQDDTLRLDLDFDAFLDTILMTFEGGFGWDTLIGPSADSTWHISGENRGTIASVDFGGVENLVGAADNEDTFIFEDSGSLSGIIDGGAGGFDSLILQGGPYATMVFKPTGADSGSIHLDSQVITYSGLEPILSPVPVDNIVFDLTAEDDLAIIEAASGSMMQIRSTNSTPTFETTSFNIPSISLTINGAGGDDSVTVASDLIMSGADLTIDAEILSIDPGVTISSRQIDAGGNPLTDLSTGDSGDIELKGETITVGVGSALLSQADIGFQSGDIRLQAISTVDLRPDTPVDPLLFETDNAESKIELLGATLKGRTVVVTATADTSKTTTEDDDPFTTFLTDIGLLNFSEFLGWSFSKATADVRIGSGTTILADSDAIIKAEADSESIIRTLGLVLGFTYAESEGISKAYVENGASITAGNNVSIAAETINTVEATSWAIKGRIQFAMTDATSNADAYVANGATINATSLNVTADITNTIETTAEPLEWAGESSGFAVTISQLTSTANAFVDSDISIPGDINITATTTTENSTSATAEPKSTISGFVDPLKKIYNYFNKKSKQPDEKTQASDEKPDKFELSAAVTVAEASNTTNAYIGSDADIQSGGSIYVTSKIEDDFRMLATSEAEEANVAISAAVVVGTTTNKANAFIDDGADVSAAHLIEVSASTTVPNPLPDNVWDAVKPSDFWDGFQKVASVESVVQDFATSYLRSAASANDDTGKFALSGSVNILTFDNTADAYIGAGATINQDTFYAPLDDQTVRVDASNEIKTINLVGVFSFTLDPVSLIEDPTGIYDFMGSKGKASLGGSYNQVNYKTTTQAVIKDGADVRAKKEVIVEATSDQFDFLMAVSGGQAEKFGISGAVSYANQDSLTLAQIQSGAVITSGALSVMARDDTRHINVTGGVVLSENLGVGASVGINEINRETYAVIGNLPTAIAGPWEFTFNQNGDQGEIVASGEPDFNGSVESVTLSDGALGVREVQSISHDASTGELTFTFEGESTATPLAFDASAEEVEAALNDLTTISDAGGVNVTGGAGEPWEIRFNQVGDQAQITAEGADGFNGTLEASTVREGAADFYEQQLISHNGTGTEGTLTFSFEGDSSAPVAYNASTAEVARVLNDLDAIQNAGGVSVSGVDGGPWTIDFNEPGDWGQISAQGVAAFDGFIIPATTTEGGITNQEIQRLDNSGTEGAFRLSFGGQTTRPIAYDASVTDVEQALNELATVQAAGGIKVTAAPGGDPSLDTVNVSGDVTLDATSDGNFYVFSLAASVRTKGDDGSKSADPQSELDSEDPLDGETLPALFGDAEGAPTEDDEGNPLESSKGQGKTGIGIAGDVSINTITDSAMAYINDRGKFTADSLTLSSLNETDLIAASGAAAMSTGGSDKTSLGIAGSFSKNYLLGKTKSYIVGATITETHALTLTAQRTGDIFSLTAGGALVPDKKGIAIAGSVSLNKIQNETETFLDRVQAAVRSSAPLNGGIFLSAVDTSEMLVIAGSLSYGGKAGIGASVALNKNYNTTRAVIKDSTLEHDGELTLWAINDNEITSAAAGIAASKDTLGASGAVSLNFIDNDVEASISGSSNRNNLNGSISLLAKDDSLIQSLAGAVGASKKIGFGGALAYNSIKNSITAYIDDSQIETSGSLDVQALSLGKIKTISAGAAGAQKLALAGAVSLNFMESTIDAHISNSPYIDAAGTISVLAADSATISALSGSVAGAGKVAIGASVGYNDIANTTKAYIYSSDVTSSAGNILIGARESTEVTSIAAGGAGAGKVAIGGSVTINDIGNTTTAYIDGNATVSADGSVMVSAHDTMDMLLVAGVLGGAGTAAIGVSNTTVITNNLVESYIGDAQVTAKGKQPAILVAAAEKDVNGNRTTESLTGIAVTATSWEDIQSFAVAGQGAGKAAIAGSATVNVLDETTTAFIGSGATINGNNSDAGPAQGVNVVAYDDTDILSVAGALSGAGTAGIGAGADVGVITKDTQAFIWADTVNASGDVKVQANSTEDILSIAASLGGGGTAGIAGSAGVYVMDITTRAFIGDDPLDLIDLSAMTTTVAAEGSVLVSAFDDTELDIIAGNIAGGGTAGIGVAAAVTVIDKTTEAFLGPNADVTGKGGGDGVTAYTGEFTTDFVPDSGSDDFAAVPAAQITQVDDVNDTITFAAPHDFATGQAVIYTKGISDINIEGGDPLEEGETYYVIAADTDGTLNATEIKLAASEQDAYNGNAINLANSTLVGTHSLTDGIPSAPNGDVTAPGQQLAGGMDTDFDDDGQNDLSPDSATQTQQRTSVPGMRTVKGVAVSAVNKDDIETIGVSGGGAGTVAVNIGGSVNVISNDTFAYVADGAKVNKDTDITDGEQLDQSVLVAAGNDLHHMGIAGAISISGTVSVTPGADVTVITNNTKAFIDDGAEVRADKNIEVAANAREDILSIAAGVGGSGTVGIGVSASVYVMDNTTYAFIGNDAGNLTGGAIAKAGGNILISAADTTEIFTVAGSLGIGFGAAGIGGAAGITIIDKDTQAFAGNFATVDAKGNGLNNTLPGILDGSNTVAGFGTESALQTDEATGEAEVGFRGLAVQSQSQEDLFVIGASAGGGLYAGLAGGVTVDVINSDTFAYIGTGAEINQESLNEQDNQSVNVSAANEVSAFTLGGGLAIGAVGIAGGVDVGIIRNDTQAYIGSNARVEARRDVDINALSRKDIESYAMSVGAGLGAIAGSVSVWSIGSEFGDATYSYTEVDTGDESKSTSSPETAVSKDDITSTLSTQGDSGEGDPVQGFVDNLGTYDSTDQNGPNDDTPDNTQELGKAISKAGTGISGKSNNLLTGAMAEPGGEPLLGGTSAYVGSGATIHAGADVNIRARDRLDHQVVVGSASLGGIGIGAAVAVINVDSHTNAFIAPQATVNAGSGENDDVLVHASFVEDFYGLSISGQMSGALSLGAQVVVFNDSSTQTASIGGPVDNEANSATVDQAGGSVIVEAKADRTIEVLTAGGQLSLGAGIGASVALINAHGSTTAVIDDAHIGQGGTVGKVQITAESVADVSAETYSVTGGLGIGLGASVALATYDPTIEASIRNDADITVSNDVTIESHSLADVDTEAIGITLGGVAALGASVSIATNNPTIKTRIGNARVTSTDGSVILRAVNNYVPSEGDPSEMIRLDQGSDAYALAGSGSIFFGAAGAYSEAETSANMDTHIASGAAITAGNDVSLQSLNNNDAEAESTGAAGGLVGVGVSLGYATTGGSTETYIGGADIAAGNDVEVKADGYYDAAVDTFAAAGGIVGGAGNDANAKVNPTVKAEIRSGASITASDEVIVEAITWVSAKTVTEGISAGGLAVGASFADSQVNSTVTAYVGGTITAGSLTVTAGNSTPGDSDYSAEANATGSAGALVGIDATNSDARTVSTVKSYVANGSNLTINGATTIGATNNTKQKADANSNVGGLIAAGISDADASSVTVTEAYLGTDVTLTGGSLSITAAGTDDNYAETTAGSIGLAGVASASAETTTTSSTSAEIKDGSVIDVAANDVLPFVDGSTQATHTTDDGTQTVSPGQTVDVLPGHTGTGEVGTRYEYIGKYAHYNTNNEGPQEVNASETVDVLSGFEGTGEVGNRYRYIGSAPRTADLSSEDFSNTSYWENLGAIREPGGTIDLAGEDFSNAYNWQAVGVIPGTGEFKITAEHTAKPNSKVRSLAGGLFGGAGAEADNTITSTVQASVGDSVDVEARDLTIEAINHVNKRMLPEGNIKGEAGGLIAGGGADSDTTISLTTLISIGDGASLEVVGSSAVPGNFTLRTLNDIVANEKVVLFAGGGLSGLFGNASIMAETDLARVEIGDADLKSVGAINISARGQAEVTTLVEAEAYGLGTLITGMAESIIRPANEVAIGTGAHIVAKGDLNLSAGTSTDFARDNYTIEVRHDSFAGSAIPLDDVDARAFLIQHNTIDIDSGAVLETARGANLHAERLGLADMLAKAKAVNWMSSIADALNGAAAEYQYKGTSHAESHGLVQMDGTVRTGIERHRSLTLDDWNPVTGDITEWGTVNETDVGIDFWVTREKLESDLAQELADARSNLALYEETNATLATYYHDEITRLEGLLAAEGLLTYSTITIDEHGFSPGDAVVYHNTGSGDAIGGLVEGQTYYVIAKDDKPDILALAASYEDATAETPKAITLKPVGASSSHSLSGNGSTQNFTLENLGGSSRVEQYVMTVHVAPVWAEAGSIDVRADVLQGGGIFDAPGDPSVTIWNHTPAFLVVHGITIPENNGGLFFTGDPILAAQDVIERNEFNIGLDALTPPFGEICGHWNLYDPAAVDFLQLPPDPSFSDPPDINIINDFEAGTLDHDNDGQPETYPWPDITVVGDIDNLGGDVLLATFEQGEGDVLLEARIRAQNLTIVAGGALYVDGVTDFAVGGEPYKKYDAATTGKITSTYDPDGDGPLGEITVTSYYAGIAPIHTNPTIANTLAEAIASQPFADEATVYADKIFINAEYLNINGLIQSGRDNYNLVLGPEIASQIADIESAQMTGSVRLSPTGSSDFIVRYDTVSDQIVVDEMRVSGGKIEMTGHIINTGTGEIRVLGGYGNINITNTTAYDLVLNRLDASQRGAGTLVIIDKAKGGSANPTATSYFSSGGEITRIVDDGTGPVVEKLTGNTDTYEPQEGWRYGWSVGVETFERSWKHVRSSSWLGLDDFARDPANINWDTTEVAEQPKLMDEGPYYFRPDDADPDLEGYQDPIPDAYTHEEQTQVLDEMTVKQVAHWSTSTWYGTTTYHDIFVGETYERTIDTHTVEADRPFTVRFVGSEEGQVSVTSDSNVVLKGSIVNPSGTTAITSNNGSIEQIGEDPYVSGKRIELSAATGIGGNTSVKTSLSGEPVYQYTTDSLNYSGDLPVVNLGTETPSNVFDIASGDRVKLAQNYSNGGVGGAVYQYKGDPAELDLGIQDYSNTSNWELVNHWYSLGATTTTGDIQIEEIIGDLAVDRVVASGGGDVTLSSRGRMEIGRNSTGMLYEGLIEGGGITLTAGGDVGSSNDPLILESGNLLKDTVTITADGSVYFKEKTGNLRLNQITADGAVEVEVMNGGILDANQEENRDERSVQRLRAGVWGDLQLTESTGANEKIDGLIDSYAAKKEQEYDTYWQYRNQQSDDYVGGLSNAQTYYVVNDFVAFMSVAVNGDTDTILLEANHGLSDGDSVVYRKGDSANAEIGGLTDGTAYEVIVDDVNTSLIQLKDTVTQSVIDLDPSTATRLGHRLDILSSDRIKLATSFDQAIAAEPVVVDLTASMTADAEHRFYLPGGWTLVDTFDSSGDVNGDMETITLAGHTLVTGEALTYYRSVPYEMSQTVTLSDAEKAAYEKQLGYGDDEIAALEASRTEQYHTLHGQYGGYGDVYDPNFDYTPTTAEEDAIRDSVKVWTEEELLYAVGAGLLKPVADTTITFEDPNIVGTSVTLTTNAGGVGDAVGYQAIDLTPPLTLSDDQRIALAAAERDDLVYLGPSVSAAVDFSAAENTITRTDGGSWLEDGFRPRVRLELVGSTFNDTAGGMLYDVQSVTDSELTLTSEADLTDESGADVTITPEALTPTVFTTVDFADLGSADTITRTDGGSWLTDGFSAGMRIRVMGVTDNASAPGTFYTIENATDDILTLTAEASLTDETDMDVTIAPEITKIIVIEREDVDVSATEDIVIDADTSVYLGSGKYRDAEYDLNINSVKAGTTIHIKGDKAIYNWVGESATNIEGGDLILEAAGGPIGGPDLSGKLYTDLTPFASITARAQNDIHIVERDGNMNVETMFSEMGGVYLEAQDSIVDALDHDFTKIAANSLELTATTGTIGEDGDYLEVDVGSSGTLIAIAAGSIRIRETLGDMNVEHVESLSGDVDLRAHLFILDALNSPLPEIIGNNITLIADIGGLGLSANDLDINSARSGPGVLTASSELANAYIIETDGDGDTLDDLSINAVSTGRDYTAFITAPEGSILNGRTDGGPNVVSGRTYLVARDNIGEESKPLGSEVGNIEGVSILGSTWVKNTGALIVGGVIDGSDPGLRGAGSATITATSPLTVTEDMIYPDEIILTAGDSPDAGDDLTVVSGVTVQSLNSYVELRAGDRLLLEPGSVIEADGPVTLICDFESADPEGGMIHPQGEITATSLEILGQEHDDVFDLRDLSVSANVSGGDSMDTLIGPDEPGGPDGLINSWEILDHNSGNLNGKFFFEFVESLTGGSADDTFYFLGQGRVDGIVDGGDGFDILDFVRSDFIQEAASDFLVTDLPIGDEVVPFTGTGGITRIEDILVILLAEVQEDGTLVLNMGPRAAERLAINTEDGDEVFTLDHVDGDPAVAEGETVSVTAFGITLEYEGVRAIRGSGGLGHDQIILSPDVLSPAELDGGVGNDILVGGAGADVLYGNEDNDILEGGPGDDLMIGGSGDDTYVIKPGSRDKVVDSRGRDTLDFSKALMGITVDLAKRYSQIQVVDAAGNELQLCGAIENAIGSAFDDRIVGSWYDNTLAGGAGDDVLIGAGGGDHLSGGDGDDLLVGDYAMLKAAAFRGMDLSDTDIPFQVGHLERNLYLAAAGDVLEGGEGADVLVGDNLLLVAGLALGAGIDDSGCSTKIEVGHTRADIHLGAGNDTLSGGGGDDVLIGDNKVVVAAVAGDLNWSPEQPAGKYGTAYRLEVEVEDLVDDMTLSGGSDVLDGDGGDDLLIGDNRTDVVALAGGIVYQAPDQQPTHFYGYSRPRIEVEVEDLVDDLNIHGGEDVLNGHDGADMLIGDNRTTVAALAGKIEVNVPELQNPHPHFGSYYQPTVEIEVEHLVDDLNLYGQSDELSGGGGDDLLIGDHHTTVAAAAGGIVFEVPVLDDRHCGSNDMPGIEIRIEDLVDDLKVYGRGDGLSGDGGDDVLIGDSHTTVAALAGRILVAGGELKIEIEELVDDLTLRTLCCRPDDLSGGEGADLLIGDHRTTVAVLAGSIEVADGRFELEIAQLVDGLEIQGEADTLAGDGGDDVLIGDNQTEVTATLASLYGAGSRIDIEIDQLVDELEIEGEDDHLAGGDGHDLLIGDNCTLVTAWASDIQIDGGTFEFEVDELVDDLEIEGGDDSLDGGSGDDVLIGDNRTTVLAAADNIFIEAERVKIDIDELVDDLEIEGEEDYLDGGDGNDLMGGDNSTTIKAWTEAVEISGRKVKIDIDDVVDHLDVDGDDDILVGGAGDDILYGQQDKDRLYGGEGDDTLIGGSGSDYLNGGAGDDTLNYRTAQQSFDHLSMVACAPWVDDFVGDLAFDDDILNPNGKIKILLPKTAMGKK